MLNIERAKLDDAITITKIKIAAFNKEINTYLGRDGGPEGYNKVSSQIHIINTYLSYKILLDDKIIGAFFLIRLSSDKMQFEDFVIMPSIQNRGYGYHTLELVEQMYPEIKEWYLSTPVFSVSNQHLYEKFGYQEISRNQDEIYYRKKILN